MTEKRRQFVLLDRDGTLNIERHYLSDPDEVTLLPNTVVGLRQLQALGLGLVVITNQSGVGRGMFDIQRLNAIHERLTMLLEGQGVTLDGIYFCPHTPEDNCQCRKPKPGMAFWAADDLGFSLPHTFVIGDKACDIGIGHNVGATTLLVRTGYGEDEAQYGQSNPHFIVADLLEAAQTIESLLSADFAGKGMIHE